MRYAALGRRRIARGVAVVRLTSRRRRPGAALSIAAGGIRGIRFTLSAPESIAPTSFGMVAGGGCRLNSTVRRRRPVTGPLARDR